MGSNLEELKAKLANIKPGDKVAVFIDAKLRNIETVKKVTTATIQTEHKRWCRDTGSEFRRPREIGHTCWTIKPATDEHYEQVQRMQAINKLTCTRDWEKLTTVELLVITRILKIAGERKNQGCLATTQRRLAVLKELLAASETEISTK